MIAILPYENVFKDIFLRDPKMPDDYLNDKLSKDVQTAVKNYGDDKVKELAATTFDTWTALMEVLNNDRKSIPGCFYLKDLK